MLETSTKYECLEDRVVLLEEQEQGLLNEHTALRSELQRLVVKQQAVTNGGSEDGTVKHLSPRVQRLEDMMTVYEGEIKKDLFPRVQKLEDMAVATEDGLMNELSPRVQKLEHVITATEDSITQDLALRVQKLENMMYEFRESSEHSASPDMLVNFHAQILTEVQELLVHKEREHVCKEAKFSDVEENRSHVLIQRSSSGKTNDGNPSSQALLRKSSNQDKQSHPPEKGYGNAGANHVLDKFFIFPECCARHT